MIPACAGGGDATESVNPIIAVNLAICFKERDITDVVLLFGCVETALLKEGLGLHWVTEPNKGQPDKRNLRPVLN